jgi:hypothetical protein
MRVQEQEQKTSRRFLNASRLRPLDVILSRPVGRQSKSIACVTGGRFSHAAVALSRSVLFQSTTNGVGFDTPGYAECQLIDGRHVLFQDVSDYMDIAVYRHPDVAGLSESELAVHQEAVIAAAADFNFKEYPPADAFDAIISQTPWAVRGLARLVLRRMLAETGTIVPGQFCSQLVADLFAEQNIGLFPAVVANDAVTPNLLAESWLRPVPDMFVDGPLPGEPDADRLNLARIAAEPVRKSTSLFKPAQDQLKNSILFRRTLEQKLDELRDEALLVEVDGKTPQETTRDRSNSDPLLHEMSRRALDALVRSIRAIQSTDLEYVRTSVKMERALFSIIESSENPIIGMAELAKSGIFDGMDDDLSYTQRRLDSVGPISDFMTDIGAHFGGVRGAPDSRSGSSSQSPE